MSHLQLVDEAEEKKAQEAGFICSFCCSFSHNPKTVAPCGDMYCSSCLDEYMQYKNLELKKEEQNQAKTCPNCSGAISNTILVTNPFILKQRNNFRFTCKMKKHGCVFVGSLSDLDKHTNKCEFKECELCAKVVQGRARDMSFHVGWHCPDRLMKCWTCYESYKGVHDCKVVIIVDKEPEIKKPEKEKPEKKRIHPYKKIAKPRSARRIFDSEMTKVYGPFLTSSQLSEERDSMWEEVREDEYQWNYYKDLQKKDEIRYKKEIKELDK